LFVDLIWRNLLYIACGKGELNQSLLREIREGRARALKELTDLSRRDFLQNQAFLQETR
jgi:hypothetical protein